MAEEDRAQDVELREWERNNRSRPLPVKYTLGQPGYGPAECVECDSDMPIERREHGFSLCVACKTVEEAQAKHIAR